MELVIDALDEDLRRREDIVLSARFGSVRKQVVASKALGQALCFPKLAADDKDPLVVRFDLLKRSGSAWLVLRPGGERYDVSFDGFLEAAGAGLTVRTTTPMPRMPSPPARGEAEVPPAAGADEDDKKRQHKSTAQDAKDYLEKHQLAGFFHALLHTVIRERPEDPYEFMAAQFPRHRRDAEERLPMVKELQRLRTKNEQLVKLVGDLRNELSGMREGVSTNLDSSTTWRASSSLLLAPDRVPVRRPTILSDDDSSFERPGTGGSPAQTLELQSGGLCTMLRIPDRKPQKRPTVLNEGDESPAHVGIVSSQPSFPRITEAADQTLNEDLLGESAAWNAGVVGLAADSVEAAAAKAAETFEAPAEPPEPPPLPPPPPESSRSSSPDRRSLDGSGAMVRRRASRPPISFTRVGSERASEEKIRMGLEMFWARLNGQVNEEDEFRVLRQSLTTGRWTLYTAGGKAKKPSQYHTKRAIPRAPDLPTHEPACPFCKGNESKTPDPLLAFDTQGKEYQVGELPSDWCVRVIPNIFPLLVTPPGLYGEAFQKKLANIPHSAVAEGKHQNCYLGEAVKQKEADSDTNKLLFRQVSAMGYSEVIVENCVHNGLIAIVSADQVALGLRAMQARGKILVQQPNVRQLLYFKQYGALSGGSLVHPHMQVVSLPLLTPETHNRLERAWNHYHKLGECAVCKAHVREMGSCIGSSVHSSRLIYASEHFMVIAPFAASQYRVSIVPKTHSPSWLEASQEEVEDLAKTLQLVMLAIFEALDDPEYNIYIFSCDKDEEVGIAEAVHWSMEIHPRFPAELGGLELASGIRVISGLPEEWARTLCNQVKSILEKRGLDTEGGGSGA